MTCGIAYCLSDFDVCTACMVKDEELLARARVIFDAHGAAIAAQTATWTRDRTEAPSSQGALCVACCLLQYDSWCVSLLSGASHYKGKGQGPKGGGKGLNPRGPKSWSRSWGKKDGKPWQSSSSSATWDRKW